MRWEEMGGRERYEFALGRIRTSGITQIEEGVVFIGRVKMGVGCHLKANSCIGSKGFSFGFDDNGFPIPIHHEGGVVLGDYVEIGVHSHVACATMKDKDTILEDYVKVDDSVHIAHNCHIKEGAFIAAGVTFGGGAVVGKQAWIGLGAIIKNKVKIGDHALIGAGAVVVKDVPAGMVAYGNPARVVRERRHD